jgi:outer membrane biosynthesis protein TonB
MNRRAVAPIERRMAPLVLAVIGFHAALLAIPVRSGGAGPATSLASALQVRTVAAPAVDYVATPRSSSERSFIDPQSIAPAPTLRPAEAAAELQPTPPAELVAAASASASLPLPAIGLVLPGIDSDDDYYPRALLTLPPTPIDAVVIDYPPIADDRGLHASELTLFIDESGRVARVRVEGAALPAALEEAARSAFINARFRAGEASGQAVKSRIRVEVVFDSRPIDPRAAGQS